MILVPDRNQMADHQIVTAKVQPRSGDIFVARGRNVGAKPAVCKYLKEILARVQTEEDNNRRGEKWRQ